MKVGVIGLGAMGAGIAANIVRAGHQVTVWNRSPKPVEAMKQLGATAATAPEDALQSEVLVSMLADDAAVTAVGLNGPLLDKAPQGLVHVNLATISTRFARDIALAHDQRGIGYVAAPVFGRPDAAAAARLTVIAAGAPAVVAKVEPLFQAIGAKFAVVGTDPVKANLFKISGNFMIAAAIEAMGEAAALLRKGDVDPALFFEVLTSTIFAAPVYKIYGKIISEESYDRAGFKLSLGCKDAGLMANAAEELDADLPFAGLVYRYAQEAVASGWGEKDWASLALLASKRAGLK